MWETQAKKTVIMDRMNPNRRECKILTDLEEVYGPECLIKDPTRITSYSKTLIDVILTNKPDLFEEGGVMYPEICDHGLV